MIRIRDTKIQVILEVSVLSLLLIPAWSLLSAQTVAETGSPVPIGEPFGLVHAGYSCSAEEYGILTAMGNQWMRVDFPWSSIEPQNDTWNFPVRDYYVGNASLNHQKVLAILDYDVGWLNASGDYTSHPYIKPRDIPDFLDYVNQTVRRYKDNVTAFEIWNEPNGQMFWNGPESDFFQLFNATAELIYSIDPRIIIGGAVVAGNDPGYIERMFQAGIMNRIDVICFHPYSTDVNEIYPKIAQVKEIGAKYGFHGEYWITEVGNPTGGSYGHRVSLEELPERVIKTFVYATISNITTIIWYCMYDWSDASKISDPDNSEAYFGLIYPNNTWKTGAFAFQQFSKAVSNSQYRPDLLQRQTIVSQNIVRAFLYRRADGNTTLVIWADPNLINVEGLDVTLDPRNNVSLILTHDISTGEITPLPSLTFHVGYRPIFLTFMASNPTDVVILTIHDPWFISAFIIGMPIALGIMITLLFIQKRKRMES